MSKIAKATIGLMIATIMAKILGFVREIVLASSYGTSFYSDAYLIALNIPNVIVAAIGQAIITTFIPLYYETKKSNNKEETNKFISNLITIVAILCCIMSIVGIIFAEPIVKIFAMGFEGETFILAVRFTRILLLSTICLALSYVITAFLQANNSFVIPGIMSLPYNIIVIISIILSSKYGINIMIWGTLIGILSQTLFMIPSSIKNGLIYKPYLNLNDKYLRKMLILVMPVLISVFANQFNVMIDKTLASTLSEGSVSSLNYANKLNLFITGLFITSIISVIYPRLSKLYNDHKKNKFNKTIVQTINCIILLILPVTIGAIVLSKPIVKLLFQRGVFDDKAVQMTSTALIFYSIGLIGIGLKDLLRRVFFSLQDTKTPMINSMIAILVNIVLNMILVKFMGHGGLALSTSISAILTTILLFRSLIKKIGDFGINNILKLFIKVTIASVTMGIIVYILYGELYMSIGMNYAISLFISIAVGAISYGIMIILLKIEEIDIFISSIEGKIKSKFGKSKNLNNVV